MSTCIVDCCYNDSKKENPGSIAELALRWDISIADSISVRNWR